MSACTFAAVGGLLGAEASFVCDRVRDRFGRPDLISAEEQACCSFIVSEDQPVYTSVLYNDDVPGSADSRLARVLDQLQLYEHPLLNFSARTKGEGVEVIIQFKEPQVPVHTYYFDLHPRDLDDPQFEWSFQRQLYDALHDYFVEMFIRTPQDRRLRQSEKSQKENSQIEERQKDDGRRNDA